MIEPTSLTSELPEGFSALLKLEGGEADHHQVRAEHLATVLNGMQRIAYLLATQDSGQIVGMRIKPSRATRDGYALHCGTLREGSFAIPMVAGDSQCPELALEHQQENLLDRISNLWKYVADGDIQSLQRYLPADLVGRFLREILKLLPREQEGISLSLLTRRTTIPVKLDWRANHFVKGVLDRPSSIDAVMTVTGELLSIDFATRQITILYPPGRKIICTYLPEVEDTLIDARKEPIQVTGRFVLDDQGMPSSLMDVTRIEPLDLSPLVIATIPDVGVKFHHPLELTPTLDEDSQQYLCVSEESIGLDAFALNREQLFDEIHEQLTMLWKEYGDEPDEKLDQGARHIKLKLQSLVFRCEDD